MRVTEASDETIQASLIPMVYIVDDDRSVTKTASNLLSAEGYVTRCFPNGEDFLNWLRSSLPGCIVLDLLMPHIDGETVLNELHARGCLMPVIVLSGHLTISLTVKFVRQGAFDVLEKPIDRDKLLSAVSAAFVYDSEHRNRVRGYDLLTERELEVMNLLLEAKSTKQIAAQLGISPKTVEKHRAGVLSKLQMDSVVQLMRTMFPDRRRRLPQQPHDSFVPLVD